MKSDKAWKLLLGVICGAKGGTFAIFLDQSALARLTDAGLVSITGTRPGARRAKVTADGRTVLKALLALDGTPAAVRERVTPPPVEDEPAPITVRYTH